MTRYAPEDYRGEHDPEYAEWESLREYPLSNLKLKGDPICLRLNYTTIICIAVLIFAACRVVCCETLPDAPKPHIDRMECTLLAADAGIRALDVYSTHRMLAIPGGHENLMPSAIASRPVAMASLEALDVTGVWWVGRKLERRGHRKLAHTLAMIDFAQDAPWALHNLTLHANIEPHSTRRPHR